MSDNGPVWGPGEHRRRANDRPEIDSDDLATALAHRRRRFVLHRLSNEAEPVTVRVLAAQVAAWEAGADGTTDDARVCDVERALRARHLPLLADVGLVAYDPELGIAELATVAGPLTPYLARPPTVVDTDRDE